MSPNPDFMNILNINENELQSRLAFFELKDEDFKILASLREFAQKQTEQITEALYHLIMGHPETRVFFPDHATLSRVKAMQNKYFVHLFSGTYDLAYAKDRLRVGSVHERIGMPPKWYLGAYRRYLNLISEALLKEYAHDLAFATKAITSVRKIIFFDMALAIDTYIAAHLETMRRHQAAIRELSTPVIKVHDRILLLPIIGTMDTRRAQQIMETVLTRVVQEQARVIILDIAGVPVVDTKVADHLMQTTAAVKLLGAETILTGISATIAKTVVQLGLQMADMKTRTSLSEGIELALAVVGKKIQVVEPINSGETQL